MPLDLYRDAQLGLRARLDELESRVRDREGELTELFWESLEPEVRDRLRELRGALDRTRATSFDELARAEGMLASYVDELERRIATLPVLEQEWRMLPVDAPDPPLPREPWLLGLPLHGEELREFRRAFVAAVHERDRRAEIVEGRYSCLARFHDRGAPFSLRATATVNGNGQLDEVEMELFTSVARATPALVLREETLALSFGKALGLKHEVEVGDTSFDGLFLIEGTQRAASLLLPTAIQTLLLGLARFGVPTLAVVPDKRMATLAWRFEPVAAALDLAVRVLAHVREAPTHTELRFRR